MAAERGSILVVDDTEVNRDLLVRRLQRKGYDAEAATDGGQALDLIAQNAFDLVLLDIMMPGISGFDVLEEVRKSYSLSQLPVIMVTAKDQSEDVVKSLKLGANDYVTKPIDLPILLARIEGQLARKKAETALQESERRFRKIVEETESTAFYTTDAQGFLNYANASMERSGYAATELIGKHFTDFVAQKWKRKIAAFYERQKRNRVSETTKEFPVVFRSGSEVWIEQTVTLLMEGDQVSGFQAIVRDITERKQFERERSKLLDELQRVAIHDNLTGLYNRRHFDQTLSEELHRAQRYEHPLTLLLFDLDGFKQINDQLGHIKGDEVLREFGQLILQNLRQSDQAFRYGGDEFAVLMVETNGQAHHAAERLHESFERWVETYDLGGLPFGLSIGQVTWIPGMDPNPENLLREADLQLYEEKRGKDVAYMKRQLTEKSQQVRFQAAFLNNVNELIIAMDMEGKVIYVNQTFERWYGQSSTEMEGALLSEKIPEFSEVVRQTRKKDYKPHKVTRQMNGAQASTLLVTPSELKNPRGSPYGFVFLASDISELEKTTERLVQTQQLLERLNAETQLESILKLILEEAIYLIPNADSGSAQILDEQTGYLEFVAAVNWDLERLKTIKIHYGEDIHSLHYQNRPAIITEDLSELDRNYLKPQEANKFKEYGNPQSSLSVPIKFNDRVIGKFNINNKTLRQAFNQEDLNLVCSLLPQIELAVRRAKQQHEQEQLANQLASNQQFLERLNAETQLEPILQLLLEETIRLVPRADTGSALLLNESRGELEFVAAVGWDLEALKKVRFKPEWNIQRVKYNDEPAIIKDDLSEFQHRHWPEDKTQAFNAIGLPQSFLSVPIKILGNVVGYFNINNEHVEDAFKDEDLNIACSMLPQIELAVKRAQERRNLEEHQRRLSLAFQLGQDLSQLATVESIAKYAADWAVQQYGYDLVGIALVNQGEHLIAAYSGSENARAYVGKSFPSDTPSLVSRTMQQKKPIYVDDVRKDAAYFQVDSRTRSELAVPIMFKNDVIGVLNLESFQVDAFGGRDHQLASFLSGQLAVAISNIRRGEALRQSEKFYHTLFDLAPDAVSLHDPDGRRLDVNSQWLNLFGYSREEALKIDYHKLVSAKEQADLEQRMALLKEGHTLTPYRREAVHKDGSIIPVEITMAQIPDEQNQLRYILSVARDLRELERLQQELGESERKYRTLVEESLVGVYIIQDKKVVFSNKRMEEITGYSFEDFQQIGYMNFIHPDDRSIVRERVQRRLQGKTHSEHYSYRGIRKGGQVIDIEVFGSLAQYQGKPAILGTMLDITERKRTEEAVRLRNKQMVEILEVSETLKMDLDLDRLFERIAEAIQNTLGFNRIAINLLSEDGQALTIRAVYGVPEEEKKRLINSVILMDEIPFLQERFKISHSYFVPHDADLLDEQIKRFSYVAEFGAWQPGQWHSEDFLFVPLETHEKRLIGLLSVDDPVDGQVPSMETIQGLEIFSNQAAIAIENAQLYEMVKQESAERQKAQEALRESGQSMRDLVEHSPDAIFVEDFEGTVLDVNNAACQLHGMTREELLGKNVIELVPPQQQEAVAAGFSKLIKGEEEHVEGFSLAKDQRAIPVDIRVKQFTYRGKPALLLHVRDMSERKRIEQELEQSLVSEHHQRLMAETLRDVTLALTSHTSKRAVLDEILMQAKQLVPYTTANIMLLEDNQIRTASSRGYGAYGNPDWIDKFKAEPEEFPLVLESIQTQKPILVKDTHKEPRWVIVEEAKWIRSHLMVPICLKDRVLGILRLNSDSANKFKLQDAKSLQPLTHAAAIALENARLYEQAQQEIEERIQTQRALQKRTTELESLRQVGLELTSQLDLSSLLQSIVSRSIKLLNGHAGGLYLYRAKKERLEWTVAIGPNLAPLGMLLKKGEGLSGKIWEQNNHLIVNNYHQWKGRSRIYEGYEWASTVGVPVRWGEQFLGVLNVLAEKPNAFTEADARLLALLATHAATAIQNANLFDELQQRNAELTSAYDATIEGWARALEQRDKETKGHGQRVTELTLKLARMMDMDEQELIHVRRGALLHDIGKMAIPDSILFKPQALDPAEWEIMKHHPMYAYDLLYPIQFLKPALDIPYCHHEKWDGSGYPQGLKGEKIPLAARIFAIADVWDALCSDRSYRPAWSQEKARKYIEAQAGKHFDPQVVEAFLSLLDQS